MAHLHGVSHLLEGDLETADTSLSHAWDLATAFGSTPLMSLILAERCVVATERNNRPAAGSLARRALHMVDEGGLDGYWTSALVFAAAARSAVHAGDMPAARRLVRRAARLRPLLTYALPVVSVQALVELARACLGFVDQGGAAAALNQAAGNPEAASRPRHAAKDRRDPAGASRPDQRHHRWSVVADGSGTETRSVASDASLHARDRRSTPHLPAHGQVRGDRAVPETRGVVTQRGRISYPRARVAGLVVELTDIADQHASPGPDESRRACSAFNHEGSC